MRGAGLVAMLLVAGLPAAAIAQPVVPTPPPPSIRVDGMASREVAPDLATLTIGVTTERPTATEAAAQNNKAAAELLAGLKTAGFADRDVSTTETSLAPVYLTDKNGNQTAKVQAFRAVNTVAARSRDLAGLGSVIGHLIDGGANAIEGVDYSVEKPEPVLDELRAEAVRNARHKAEIAATAAGVKLGRILEIVPDASGGVPYAPSPRLMKAAAPVAGTTPLQPGSQRFEQRATVVWELEP